MIQSRRTQTTIVPGQMHAPGGKNVPFFAITASVPSTAV